MRFLYLISLALAPLMLHAEESFTLTYTGTQKWLTQSEKAPLLALRTAAAQQTAQPTTMTVRTPAKNPKLQSERLAIAAEIISRKADGIFIKHIASDAPKNQLIFTLK